MSLPHWEYFLAIESDLEKCSRYVDFSKNNYNTFSLELARIILVSCSEIDTVLKNLCKKIDATKRPDKITEYYPIITSKYPKFTEYQIEIPRYKIELQPWKEWKATQGPDWWSKGYNKIKHERDKNFMAASLENALNATAGLFSVMLYYYRDTYDHDIKIDYIDKPRIFEPKDYQKESTGWEGARHSWDFDTPDDKLR